MVCYSGSQFRLLNASDTITWKVTAPFSFDPNNPSATNVSGNPVTVYRTGTSMSDGTLKAFVNSTEVYSKPITPCPIPTISGTSSSLLLCGATVNYYISGLPGNIQGSQVSWSCSNNLEIQGNNTGLGMNFKVKNSNYGAGWVKATIGGPYNNLEVQQTVTTAAFPGFESYDLDYIFCGGYASMNPPSDIPGLEAYRWEISPSYGNYYLSNQFLFAEAQFYDNGYWTVKAYAINSCYNSSPSVNHQYEFYVSGCRSSSGGFAFPNPVDDILTIDLDAFAAAYPPSQSPTSGTPLNPPVYDVRLLDGQGNLLRQQKAKGGTVQFNVSNLPDGMYYLHIYDGVGATPIMEIIVVEH